MAGKNWGNGSSREQAATCLKMAGVGAVMLAVNPLYLGLSFSFMSDIPFLGVFAPALYFVVRGLNRDRIGLIVVGLLLGGVSMFVRQLGLALFLELPLY